MSLFLFLALLGLGAGGSVELGVRPRPPAPAKVLRYAPPDADHMVVLHVASTLGPLLRALRAAPDRPPLSRAPKKVARRFRALLDEVDEKLRDWASPLGLARPERDIRWVAAWTRYGARGMPDVLIAVRGRLPKDIVNRIARTAGMETTVVRGRTVALGGEWMVARAIDGMLLAGTRRWVEPRMLATWTPLRAAPDSAVGRTRRLMRSRPFLILTSVPSVTARDRFDVALRGPDESVLREIAAHHRAFSFVATTHSLTWTWEALDDDGARRAHEAARGIADLVRGGRHAVRALVRLGATAWPERTRAGQEATRVFRNAEDMIRWADDALAGGPIEADVSKTGRTVRMSLRADRVQRIVPLGTLAPLLLFAQ